MMYKDRLELTRQMLKDMTWVLFWYVAIAAPLFGVSIVVTWGEPSATFISCLVATWGVYHFVDGIKLYRQLKDEEKRLLRALARAGEDSSNG